MIDKEEVNCKDCYKYKECKKGQSYICCFRGYGFIEPETDTPPKDLTKRAESCKLFA